MLKQMLYDDYRAANRAFHEALNARDPEKVKGLALKLLRKSHPAGSAL